MPKTSLHNTSEKRLVITGMGACSAGGENLPALWDNVLKGHSTAILEATSQIPVYQAKTPSFSGKDRARVRHADRSSQLALAAARETWNASGLESANISPERLGVIIGSARGPVALQEKNFATGTHLPTASLYSTFSSTAGIISNAFHAEGVSLMVSSSCTSGAAALHTAAQMIQSGMLDAAIVGAVEAPLLPSIFEQYQATGILSQHHSAAEALAPFDRDRSGTVLGEGAAFLMLESEAFAMQRGASVLGVLKAVSVATQSRQRAGLDSKGISLQKILQRSLLDAKLLPHEMSLLHLHGTGTYLNDLLESQAIASVFGSPEDQPYACATKGNTGHTLGASSLFQVLLTLVALRDSILPKITNCSNVDKECPLRIATTSHIMQPMSQGLCLTSGFWGNVSSIIVSV